MVDVMDKPAAVFCLTNWYPTMGHSEICVNGFSLWPGPTLQQLISLMGATTKPRGWTNLTAADRWVRQTGSGPVSPQPSGERWGGGRTDQMWHSHLSTAAVEVFLSKVLKPSLSAQRLRGGTLTEPWNPRMPAFAAGNYSMHAQQMSPKG